MAWFAEGNKPISAFGSVVAPSTASLIAELDSTVLGTVNLATGQQTIANVTWIVGADTSVGWQLEIAGSTALGGAVETILAKTGTAQSAQFVTKHVLLKNYRIRARLFSTGANAVAYIAAEPLV